MMANGLQYRGNDATGVACMYENGETDFFKNNEPAWKFTASKDYVEWCKRAVDDRPDLKIALVHTRKATKGSPFKSQNNHPLVGNEDGAMIIHNGMISNDGPKNIVDSVTYITSRIWADEHGRNKDTSTAQHTDNARDRQGQGHGPAGRLPRRRPRDAGPRHGPAQSDARLTGEGPDAPGRVPR